MQDYQGELSFEINSETYDLPLTTEQLKTVFRVLGLKFDKEEKRVYSYSDLMLKRFNSKEYVDNPLHYQVAEYVIKDETGE